MVVFGAVLAGLLGLAEQRVGTAIAENVTKPNYHSYDFQAACGPSLFRVRFRNGSRERSRVYHVSIDDRSVPGAASLLDRFAAGRKIARIEIMHCGMDPLRPVFRGLMVLSEAESRAASMRDMLAFRLSREGGGWRMTVE